MLNNNYVKGALALFISLLSSFFILKYYLFKSTPTQTHIPKELLLNLKSGDIIFRKESNQISDIFAKVNNLEYSHIGMISIEDKNVKVIHIEDNGQENDFKSNDINEFLHFATKYSIYRSRDKIDEDKLNKSLSRMKKQNLAFDLEFSGDKSDNKVYCSELIYNIHKESSSVDIKPKLQTYMSLKYIPLKSFMDEKHFTKIY